MPDHDEVKYVWRLRGQFGPVPFDTASECIEEAKRTVSKDGEEVSIYEVRETHRVVAVEPKVIAL